MITAVLFDLDGTLLDIDLEGFLRDYFGLLGPALTRITGIPTAKAIEAVVSGTQAMHAPHATRTNREVFNERFLELTGVELDSADIVLALERFYTEEFPSLQRDHGPRAGSTEAILAARDAGMRVAIATNPIFPVQAVHERMRWAKLDPDDFDLVTSYETCEACKPHPLYFRRVAEDLGVEPTGCVMVGDDPVLDISAADIGMRTFYVGAAHPVTADWNGDLFDFANLISRVAS